MPPPRPPAPARGRTCARTAPPTIPSLARRGCREDPKASSSGDPVAGRCDRRSPRPARGRFGERRRRVTPVDPPPARGRVWITGMPGGVRLGGPSLCSGAGGLGERLAGPEAGEAADPPGGLRDGSPCCTRCPSPSAASCWACSSRPGSFPRGGCTSSTWPARRWGPLRSSRRSPTSGSRVAFSSPVAPCCWAPSPCPAPPDGVPGGGGPRRPGPPGRHRRAGDGLRPQLPEGLDGDTDVDPFHRLRLGRDGVERRRPAAEPKRAVSGPPLGPDRGLRQRARLGRGIGAPILNDEGALELNRA